MGSPDQEERNYILSVHLQDGKGFGPDVQAIACTGTFAGESKTTPFSVGRDAHVWNITLQWRVTLDHYRRLTSLGQKDCKVVLHNKDGDKVGWFIVDLRAAKLQHQYKKEEGQWMTLLQGGRKGDTPQVRIFALFYEDRPGNEPMPPPSARSPSRLPRAAPGTARQPSATATDRGGDDNYSDDFENADADGAAAEGSGAATAGDAAPDGGGAGADPQPGDLVPSHAGSRAASTAAGPAAGLPSFETPARGLGAAEGPFRRFVFTLDLRSFQSGHRLPVSVANVYVQAMLPPELIELVVSSGHKLPPKSAPLRSHPAVDIPRGTEGALPNGHTTVEFTAGVVQLARVLAREPRASVEVWHKERFRTDMLLGAASVPLSPLLQGAWVDGYAPVFAIMAATVAGQVHEERVQMGMVRVILSLEDKGPVLQQQPSASHGGPQASAAQVESPGYPRSGTTATVAAAAEASAGLEMQQQPSQAELSKPVSQVASRPGSQQGDEGGGGDAPAEAPVALAAAAAMAPPPTQPARRAVTAALAAAAAAPAGAGGKAAAMALHGTPEFEVAWELEVWKKAEEARWRSALREREAQRMLVLESEWRRRERAREAEVGAVKQEYQVLEDKAQQVLASAEQRERRILAAEEALLRRRKELEREHAARMAEAEAAVRRLQVECEHQLDIERDRNAELVRRVALLEERLAMSEARGLAVENAFAEYRAATRATPEVELARQLAEAREAVKAAEERAGKAARAKQGYKEQVRKLAEQLASLQRRRHNSDMGAALPPPPPGRPHESTLRLVAEEQTRYATGTQAELAAMRQQLAVIKAAALAQLSPTGSPRHALQQHQQHAGGQQHLQQHQQAAGGSRDGGGAAGPRGPDGQGPRREGEHGGDVRRGDQGLGAAGAVAAAGNGSSSRSSDYSSSSSRAAAGRGHGAAATAAPPAAYGPTAPERQQHPGTPTRSSTGSITGHLAAEPAGQPFVVQVPAATPEQLLQPPQHQQQGAVQTASGSQGARVVALPTASASGSAGNQRQDSYGQGARPAGSGASQGGPSASPQEASQQLSSGRSRQQPPQQQQQYYADQGGRQEQQYYADRGSQQQQQYHADDGGQQQQQYHADRGGQQQQQQYYSDRGSQQQQEQGAGPSRTSANTAFVVAVPSTSTYQQQQQPSTSASISRPAASAPAPAGSGDNGGAGGSSSATGGAPAPRVHFPGAHHRAEGSPYASPRGPVGGTSYAYQRYGGGGGDPRVVGGGSPGGSPNADLLEVQRLIRRKLSLLENGANIDDPVVQVLDEQIARLMAENAGLA